MKDTMRVLVAHPAQQHSYRLATALKKAGMLGGYATTVYNAKGSLSRGVAKVLPPRWRTKAEARICDTLDPSEVHQFFEVGGLAALFFHNIRPMRRWYWQVKRKVEDRFAAEVARFAIEERIDVVVSYDGTSPLLFEMLRDKAPHVVRILDMSAANALYLRSVYERDFEIKPDFAEKLRSEWRRVWDPVDMGRTERELAATDFFLCGSEFVKRSLGFSGIAPSRCAVCHYGVDTDAFASRDRVAVDDDQPLSFIYVGGTNEVKGIAYLLDAFVEVDPKKAKLMIVGQNNLEPEVTEKYAGKVEFVGPVPHCDIAEKLAASDVMLFPSLGDGFPLSIMEALSCGVPVVCSNNTGASDIILDGENGFVIPAQDQSALDRAIDWFCDNRVRIPAMARRARETAEECTWDRYEQVVAAAVADFIGLGVEGVRRG